ncbi:MULTISPECIES: hypothetical protein [unclassified Pseudomonas]|uniref:hypothetical protein n=1 Tax=Pseudomonas sp. CFBP 8772 TaxID=2775284 RepID=UPI0017805FB4|nr:hypothetical protein [Pseudomonas sp. CFBP 8772]MBD8596714.1 hypothetical protein [Pseudomonas sp. CFBP 8772]
MISDQDVLDIDNLESMLLEQAISYDQLRRHYAILLLDMLDKKRYPDTDEKDLEALALYLKDAAATARINRDSDELVKVIGELWTIEGQYRTLSPDLSRFARCSILCFSTEQKWIEEDSGDQTPLLLYLYLLKKIDPEVCPALVGFFKRLLD